MDGTRGANTRRAGSTPAAVAAARRLSVARAFICDSHNTLPSTAASSRIQAAKTAADILKLLLKQQNTNPWSGRPASVRDGVSGEIAFLVSLTRKQSGRWTILSVNDGARSNGNAILSATM